MRRNLLSLLLLLAVIAWVTPGPTPSGPGLDMISFVRSNGFEGERLQIIRDRFKLYTFSCSGDELRLTGTARLEGDHLTFSGQGRKFSAELQGTPFCRVLRFGREVLFETPRRIEPAALSNPKRASCLGVYRGMRADEVPYPREQVEEGLFYYRVGWIDSLVVRPIDSTIEWVSGPGLEIDGKAVLNARSTLEDLDRLSGGRTVFEVGGDQVTVKMNPELEEVVIEPASRPAEPPR